MLRFERYDESGDCAQIEKEKTGKRNKRFMGIPFAEDSWEFLCRFSPKSLLSLSHFLTFSLSILLAGILGCRMFSFPSEDTPEAAEDDPLVEHHLYAWDHPQREKLLEGYIIEASSPSTTDDIIERGKKVFNRNGCFVCHGIEGREGIANRNTKEGKVPALNKLADTIVSDKDELDKLIDLLQKDKELHEDEEWLKQYRDIKKRIIEGKAAQKKDPNGKKPLSMPTWRDRIKGKDLDYLVAYILSIFPEDEWENWDEDEDEETEKDGGGRQLEEDAKTSDSGDKNADSQDQSKAPASNDISKAVYIGSRACGVKGCHVEQFQRVAKTVHHRLADFELKGAPKGCESCHGPGSLHQQGGGDRTKIIVYTEMNNIQKRNRAEVCLKCHNGKPHLDWRGSKHPMNDVSCTDCHNPMRPTRKLTRDRQPNLCIRCHQQRLAQLSYPSHHPIKEGKIKCTDCHNQHGSESVAMIKADTVNQLCFKCHPQMEGPFIYEHPPVTEDCRICHNPHGTIADNLRVQNEPFLCLQCHPSHINTQFPGIVNSASRLNAGQIRRAFLTKCTQCHSQIHGSDLPSTTGRGALTR